MFLFVFIDIVISLILYFFVYNCFSVPQDYKLNPGAVEAIFEQPEHPDHILIGYNRGLIVLWNRSDNTSIKTFVSSQQLESLCWHEDGKSFTSSHNDGKFGKVFGMFAFICTNMYSSGHERMNFGH